MQSSRQEPWIHVSSYISSSDLSSRWRSSRGWVLAIVLLAAWVMAARVLNRLDPYARPDPETVGALSALGPSTRLVVLGTSHVSFGINPAEIGPWAVNMGVAGADYENLLPILRRRLVDMPNLQVILLETDNICLFSDVLRQRDFYNMYAWGLLPADVPLGVRERIQQKVMEHPLVAPFVFSRRLTPRAWARRARPTDWLDYPGQGFVASQGQMVLANDGTVCMREHDHYISETVIARNRAAFVELIRLAKQHGVQIVLITLPHHAGYSANASSRWKKLFDGLLGDARAHLGDDFIWWNMDGDPIYSDTDFHDGHHLNEWGAAKLSKLLRERLEAYGMGPN